MVDFSINEMQRRLQDKYKDQWEPICPDHKMLAQSAFPANCLYDSTLSYFQMLQCHFSLSFLIL